MPSQPDKCTCLPPPDGDNDACPLHGEEAPCGHCGHDRADHTPMGWIDEPCGLCSCVKWLATDDTEALEGTS